MMMNMFSMFDPLTLMNLKMNNLMILPLMMMNLNMWKFNQKNKLINLIWKPLNSTNNKSSISVSTSMIMMLLTANTMNILPMNFSTSLNLSTVLTLTMMIWTMNLLMSIKMNTWITMMNFSPMNTPLYLTAMINIIETNSLIFQNISLTMRLTINMMMGHIIIKLTSNTMISWIFIPIEIVVVMIQTYIFTILNMMNMNNSF